MDTPIIDEVIEQLKSLPNELQRRVLEFTRALTLSTPARRAGQAIATIRGHNLAG